MLTPKENFLRTLQGRNPDRLVNEWESFEFIQNDPILAYLRFGRERGGEWTDRWGTIMCWPEDQPGVVPHITPENKALKDIRQWRDIQPPDIQTHCTDWAQARQTAQQVDRNEKMVLCFMPTGIFEQAHNLMGFEDMLCNMLLEPDAMHALLKMIFEYRMTFARMLIENIRPDIILSHDDWGTKTMLFMHPDTWREFFKPLYRELYRYMHSQGVLVMHHADSFCEPIAEDMAEIGVDVWQGCLPQNDIPAMQRKLGGRMALMGGIDASVIDVAGWNEKEVRAETRRACEQYAPAGYFIPCVTYGGPKTIFPQVDEIVKDEIQKCSARMFPG